MAVKRLTERSISLKIKMPPTPRSSIKMDALDPKYEGVV